MEKTYTINIKNLNNIKSIEFTFELKQGLMVLVGDNGVGKSTVLSCLSGLVENANLSRIFKNIKDDSEISYFKNKNLIFSWKVKDRKFILEETENNNENTNYIKGFSELSLQSGLRFDNKQKTRINSKIKLKKRKVDEFIRKEMSYIIDNCEELGRFENLYLSKELQSNSIYFNEIDNTVIWQSDFSLGEYFLLSILKIINGLRKRQKSEDRLRMLIIDEVDLALHPLAQKRLVERLYKWSKEYNLFIIVATHSIQTIKEIKSSSIYHIENNKITPNCSSSYVIKRIYEFTYIDTLIIVEDREAKIYLEKFIEKKLDKNILENRLCFILPLGGTGNLEQIIKEYDFNEYFPHANVVVVFDGDYQDKLSNKNNKFPYSFLPIPNVEKELVKLIKNNDPSLEKILKTKKISSFLTNNEIKEMSDKAIYKRFIEKTKANEASVIEIIVCKSDNSETLSSFLKRYLC